MALASGLSVEKAREYVGQVENDLFAQMMGEVKPLAKTERIQTGKTKSKHEILRNLEDKDVTFQHTQHQQGLNTQKVEPYLLRAAGVASKDIKKLAKPALTMN